MNAIKEYSSLRTLTVTTNEILWQLEAGIGALENNLYTTAPESADSQVSPIGGHVRHIIEFYHALLSNLGGPEPLLVSYDARKRNKELETSKNLAISEIKGIREKIGRLEDQDMEVLLSSIIDPDAPMFEMQTTLNRELVYLLDHTIHHMALIKMIAREHKVTLGKNFGLAQSTKAHEQGTNA